MLEIKIAPKWNQTLPPCDKLCLSAILHGNMLERDDITRRTNKKEHFFYNLTLIRNFPLQYITAQILLYIYIYIKDYYFILFLFFILYYHFSMGYWPSRMFLTFLIGINPSWPQKFRLSSLSTCLLFNTF